ncbi:MAG: BNR repeat-containing protein, partial [Muribaculaceae bacterium]|nr:BNR repeat-containing protein [Muribaculaceae bacterium]
MAVALATPAHPASSLPGKDVRLVKAGDAYSRTSVNTAVFRGSSVISHGDSQYISYYDKDGYVVLGKRDISDKEWQLHRTQYKGKISDAHNVISIGVDGDGFLHVSFDHHGNRLRYARSVAPG